MSKGKMIYRDPSFKSGSNSCSVYNNSGNGNVTVTRVSGISGNPNSSGYCLKVKTTGTASPDRGGFYWGATAKANRVLIVRLIANIPTGYTLKFTTNALGTGASHKWLTAYAGTGKWKNTPIKLYAAHPVHSPIQVTFIFQEVVHRLPPHLWNGISVMLRYSM